MADRLPVGEPRFVHLGEPGTTLQPGAWAGPTHVMVVEHRSDETSLIIRPFLDADEDDPVNEPGDLLENVERLSCGSGDVCVPDEITDPDIWISVCTGSIPLLNEPYTGVCLSKCLKLPLDILIMSGSCPNTHDCVPCVDPLTGQDTGAPGCEQL